MVDKRKREIRARMDATGEPYSRAARELDKQRAEQTRGNRVDPTATDVTSKARSLVDLLTERRPEAANPECHEPWEFTRAIDRAAAAGMDLVDQLDAGTVDKAAIERATRMAEQVQAAQRLTVNGLNFAMARDVGRAYALVRLARAASQGRCLLGQAQESDCSPGPERVRLRIHDAFGNNTGEPGCIQHAAEEWTRWDHGGECEVEVVPTIGDAATATAVAQLGAELRRLAEG